MAATSGACTNELHLVKVDVVALVRVDIAVLNALRVAAVFELLKSLPARPVCCSSDALHEGKHDAACWTPAKATCDMAPAASQLLL